MKTQLRVQLLGTSFTIQTDESREHVENVLTCLKKRIAEIREKNPSMEPIKVSLLAGLNLTDELMRQKGDSDTQTSGAARTTDEIEIITRNLIEKIDGALEDEDSYSGPFPAPE
jgi:cell division protein ZapA (FtsZ GTPase activity inhibitor)